MLLPLVVLLLLLVLLLVLMLVLMLVRAMTLREDDWMTPCVPDDLLKKELDYLKGAVNEPKGNVDAVAGGGSVNISSVLRRCLKFRHAFPAVSGLVVMGSPSTGMSQ